MVPQFLEDPLHLPCCASNGTVHVRANRKVRPKNKINMRLFVFLMYMHIIEKRKIYNFKMDMSIFQNF